ncbi:unnamed protein product [Boreogadus saida]
MQRDNNILRKLRHEAEKYVKLQPLLKTVRRGWRTVKEVRGGGVIVQHGQRAPVCINKHAVLLSPAKPSRSLACGRSTRGHTGEEVSDPQLSEVLDSVFGADGVGILPVRAGK